MKYKCCINLSKYKIKLTSFVNRHALVLVLQSVESCESDLLAFHFDLEKRLATDRIGDGEDGDWGLEPGNVIFQTGD